MIKVIVTLKRRPGISFEEFDDYWLHTHGAIVARLFPKVQKYVQHHLVSLPPDSPMVDQLEDGNILRRDTAIDGVVELYFDSVEDWLEAYNEWYLKAGEELQDDEKKFLDMSQIRLVVTRPIVIKDLVGPVAF